MNESPSMLRRQTVLWVVSREKELGMEGERWELRGGSGRLGTSVRRWLGP